MLLHLFVNNRVPAPGDVPANFKEPDGAGYSSIPLVSSTWRLQNGYLTYPRQEFVFNGAVGQIYGYYVTRSDGGLLCSERFDDGPYMVVNLGDKIGVSLRLPLD